MHTNRVLEQWRKERDEALASEDLKKFKAFFLKWQRLGVYDKNMKLPSYDILQIAFHKMVLAATSLPKEQKERSRAWLKEHGFKEEF